MIQVGGGVFVVETALAFHAVGEGFGFVCDFLDKAVFSVYGKSRRVLLTKYHRRFPVRDKYSHSPFSGHKIYDLPLSLTVNSTSGKCKICIYTQIIIEVGHIKK